VSSKSPPRIVVKGANGYAGRHLVPAPRGAPSGYGRARLWLGISAVGTIVTATGFALALGAPESVASRFDSALPQQLGVLVAFVFAYAALQAPFDILGGYVLPRRFGRAHLPAARFAASLLRGVAVHSTLFVGIAVVLLTAGRAGGVPGLVAAGVVTSLLLLAGRAMLAGLVAPLRRCPAPDALDAAGGEVLPTACVASEDEGFTGGVTGVLRARRSMLPEHWRAALGVKGFQVVVRRRGLVVASGAWRRGRFAALAFTWAGILLAALAVGSTGVGTTAGIIECSLLFTLWSFLGLLVLPTLSRRGVTEIDERLRESGLDPRVLDEAVRRLDDLQDRETDRPSFVETIFHPIPSVRNRLEGPRMHRAAACWDVARSAVFLSAAGLGLLGRAVHCNCGRPALWVFLPAD